MDFNGKTVCFDVDGVVCDDRDPTLPYRDRPPYPYAAEAVRQVKRAGGTVVFLTARYMNRHGGSQERAAAAGLKELEDWLRRHDIPYDAVYLGKPSADLYVDDRALRVRSNDGPDAWLALQEPPDANV